MPQGSRCWHRLKPQIVVYLGLLRGNHTTENCLPSPRQLEKSLLARHWPRVPSRSRLPPVLLAVLASPWLASFVHSPGGRRPLPPQEYGPRAAGLCRARAVARAPDPGCPPGEFPQCAWPAVWSWLCFFRVCLSVLFFLPVVCMKLATYTCVASMCESKPRAYPELWTVSCLILLVIFCQLLNFRVCIPFPVSSWTGPVPGRAEWQHTRTLLLPDAIHHRWAVGFSCTAFQTATWMPSAGTRSAPLLGCVTQPL